MFYLKRNILLAAIGADMAPLLQQVLPDLVALQCPLLVLNSIDLWIPYHLHVESDQFHAHRRNMAGTHESQHPSDDVAYPTLQRWWEPSLLFVATIPPPCFTV